MCRLAFVARYFHEHSAQVALFRLMPVPLSHYGMLLNILRRRGDNAIIREVFGIAFPVSGTAGGQKGQVGFSSCK